MFAAQNVGRKLTDSMSLVILSRVQKYAEGWQKSDVQAAIMLLDE